MKFKIRNLIITIFIITIIFSNSLENTAPPVGGAITPPLEGQWIWLKIRDMCVKTTGKLVRISQAPCENKPNFIWKLTRNGDGTYFIKSQDGDQVLDVYYGQMVNCAGIIAQYSAEVQNQRWTVHNYSQPNQFLIKSKSSGRCLDNTGRYGPGNLFHQWDCSTGNGNQAFTMALPGGGAASRSNSQWK